MYYPVQYAVYPVCHLEDRVRREPERVEEKDKVYGTMRVTAGTKGQVYGLLCICEMSNHTFNTEQNCVQLQYRN